MIDGALSVVGLTEYLQLLLEGDRYLQKVWVTGEVSSARSHPKGIFFTLSDPEGEAAINCVFWGKGEKQAGIIQRGENIIVLGSLKLYNKRGEYRLTVYECLPSGRGLQDLRFQQLKSRLEREGFFEKSRKRALPYHPKTIAVVTSSTAAAWGDIQQTLKRRYPGITILFSPATVQGAEAPDSIVSALESVNLDGRAEVIILARGGGAVEDLACFNDERVVRAIFASKIPVITGIGHQRDESLADLVADYSAHTPTAAAEIAVPDLELLRAEHDDRIERLIDSLRSRYEGEIKRIARLEERLRVFPLTSRQLTRTSARLELLKEKLISLDPGSIVRRGYAVLRLDNGRVVRSISDLRNTPTLTVQLPDGMIDVRIEIIDKY